MLMPMSSLHPASDWSGPGQLLGFRSAVPQTRAPVLMTHGSFSNADILVPLANTLAEAGHPVWIIEWRNRTRPIGTFDFHDLAEGEIAAAVHAISQPVHLLAHSGGGLAMCFALLDPEVRQNVRSLTMLATQGTRLTEAPLHLYAAIRAMWAVGQITGRWPRRVTGLGPCDESKVMLDQWIAFNRAKRIWTREGQDLFDLLPQIQRPVFALAGAGDTFIARPDGCADLARAFGPEAKYHLCEAASDGEDFTHSRLIRSRAAARSIWPRIVNFMQAVEDTKGSAA